MPIEIHIDGEPCAAEADELLASVLLRQPVPIFRKHPVDGSSRAAFCMMGVCFECLVEIDGVPNQQACVVKVRDGMQINRGLS
ncbi:(2Fe-2S)-binding protein [Roseobacter sp.]|uniref:(2Fe-2S)-binding protein n=1 Tax=Roseobacter sp. TaxID=1907202 RepID=UPI00385EC46F